MRNGDDLTADTVVQSIVGIGVDETIANPMSGQYPKNESPNKTKGHYYYYDDFSTISFLLRLYCFILFLNLLQHLESLCDSFLLIRFA
jgi:hypothetical protein